MKSGSAVSAVAAVVDETVSQFTLSSADLQKITSHFVQQLKSGLLDAELPFQLPAFVTAIPNGSETGRFLSVDLGGTNCRICAVDLTGHGAFSVTQAKHTVPHQVMVNARYEPLFAWIADCVGQFCAEKSVFSALSAETPAVPLGFTFSFTCDQTSLSSGTLIHWDKGWDIPSALGRDPCQLLQEALDAARLPVRVAVLANDSVGTLLARAYTSGGSGHGRSSSRTTSATETTTIARHSQDARPPQSKSTTLASVIVGTGTNAAYVERLVNIRRHNQTTATNESAGIMAVNTEWGCWDDALAVLPSTRFDDRLDAQSSNPGGQMLEKRVSGMYLGELLRLAVLDLLQQQKQQLLDFSVDENAALFQPESMDASLLSILADRTLDHASKAAAVASVTGAQGVSLRDVDTLQAVSAAIITRAARLTGAALAAIIIQSGRLSAGAATTPERTDTTTATATAAAVDQSADATGRGQKRSTSSKSAFPSCGLLRPIVHRFLSCLGRSKKAFRSDQASSSSSSSSLTSPALLAKPEPTTPPAATSPTTTAFSAQQQSEEDNHAIGIIDIGISGSVIELHPTFLQDMRAAMREIPSIGVEGDKRIRMGVCSDGSAVGAALMAQAALLKGK